MRERERSARGVRVIVVGNRHSDPGSNSVYISHIAYTLRERVTYNWGNSMVDLAKEKGN